ncbi:iron ABC transporter permease [Micromonospora sp. WMMD1082]|uniref:FecCD family ABC transporter permease n=1 Tax=Micromonospora sp. WMMD1082 TaxID=3016104 RepID=UPI00241677B7|nr:iron ABC transporter permease [Micromonospora sp. WMMD1082]MDG4797078.1 iron ABC transporter permease [Micromonospora sp. WMMD1082]
MSADADAAPKARAVGSDRPRRAPAAVAIAGGLLLLLVVGVVSLGTGPTGIGWSRAIAALLDDEPSRLRSLVVDVRLPRALLAVLVGGSLAVAGLLAQALTRNPLASPQTFGINAGAAVAIVTATIAFPNLGALGTVAALVGAAVVGAIMWALSTTGAVTIVGLALAGMTMQIVLSALVQAILIMNNSTHDIVFWLAGSVTGAQWDDVALLAPATAIGCAAALVGSRSFALLALDTTTAASLGQRPARAAGAAATIVVVLAGTAVAVAGPIGFIGLIVPHIARRLVGPRFVTQLVACLVLGPLLLLSADVLARLVAFPAETPAGIVTALLGAPVFLILAIRARRA